MRATRSFFLVGLLSLGIAACGRTPTGDREAIAPSGMAAFTHTAAGTFTNPLRLSLPGGGLAETCADPSIIRGQAPGDGYWYLYCTTDPLNSADKDENGNFRFRFIPTFRSTDLVHWDYANDAFEVRPAWVADDAGLWAPEIAYINGQYHLYYTASWTDLPGGGSAIGVATSDSPTGPWVDSGAPVVEPHAPPCCAFDKRWVFDPDILEAGDGQRYIYYGSYFGGISVRRLSADGLHSDPASQVEVTIANRYEGANVVRHAGFYYLFASATDCCKGPLTGYSVFVGRSESPTGPFLDREGKSLQAGQVGGTPVISMNGNRWVGTGHSTVITDFAGQDWLAYHAVDRNDPYFAGAVGFTKRPVLLDGLDWVGNWPTVRGGAWASDSSQPAPAAQPETKSRYRLSVAKQDKPTTFLADFSDEFSGTTLASAWSWVREPGVGSFALGGESFSFNTQAADLFVDSNNASVLTRAAPSGDYVVETKLHLNLPAEGCCFNYVQAGLVAYGGDDNFIKLTHVSIWETRQTEFAKETSPVPNGYPRYGNTVVGPPSEWTYLRIVKRERGAEDLYTGYTSTDGENWVRGGTWTHDLGPAAKIGLVSMGGTGFTAEFDYLRVYTLQR